MWTCSHNIYFGMTLFGANKSTRPLLVTWVLINVLVQHIMSLLLPGPAARNLSSAGHTCFLSFIFALKLRRHCLWQHFSRCHNYMDSHSSDNCWDFKLVKGLFDVAIRVCLCSSKSNFQCVIEISINSIQEPEWQIWFYSSCLFYFNKIHELFSERSTKVKNVMLKKMKVKKNPLDLAPDPDPHQSAKGLFRIHLHPSTMFHGYTSSSSCVRLLISEPVGHRGQISFRGIWKYFGASGVDSRYLIQDCYSLRKQQKVF